MKSLVYLWVAAEAFVPTVRVAQPWALRVSYLSEVEDAGKEKRKGEQPSDPRAHSGMGGADANAGPTSYEGFVDAEGFDGGDGQVGVVGDGKLAMEEFDMGATVEVQNQRRIDNAVGGSESKQTQKNVWGFSTGYADELKARGMVDIDEYGEDRLKQRRQQLENFKNQGEVRAKKEGQVRELAALQGKDYVPARQGSYLAQFEKQDATDAIVVGGAVRESSLGAASGGLAPGDELHGTFEFTAALELRAGETLKLDNHVSRYSEFVAGFTADSSAAFSVEPTEGTLNRRGGEPTDFIIKFQPKNYAESFSATLVIQTEDYTWTYNCLGKVA